MQHKDNFTLLDVREPYELEICRIGGINIPLGSLASRVAELDQDKPIIVYCKAGSRSKKAANILLHNGFKQVYNLKGGILQWIEQIAPQMKRY